MVTAQRQSSDDPRAGLAHRHWRLTQSPDQPVPGPGASKAFSVESAGYDGESGRGREDWGREERKRGAGKKKEARGKKRKREKTMKDDEERRERRESTKE
eukprot:747664-Hanusia_phi.AAC.4